MDAAVNTREYKEHINRTYFRRSITDFEQWAAQFPGGPSATVVHIPARSGSTRLKDKNIRELGGLPLLAYSVLVARRLTGVDRVIVDTDSPRYAEIARHHGAETPYLRPAELATATSRPGWSYYFLLRHLLEEDYPVKTILTLLPTSPFRNLRDIQGLVERVRDAGMVATCLPVDCSLDRFRLPGGEPAALRPGDCGLDASSFLYKPLGKFTGQHVANTDIVRKEVVAVDDPLELIDIDTEDDFRLASEVVDNRLYDFGFSL